MIDIIIYYKHNYHDQRYVCISHTSAGITPVTLATSSVGVAHHYRLLTSFYQKHVSL